MLGGGRAESSQGPKKGGEGRKAAGGRVIGKDWNPERPREGRGIGKAEIDLGDRWTVEGRGEGLGGSMVQSCPLKPMLINLHPCPHKVFSRVKVKKETGNRSRESISFSFFIQVPLESSALVPCLATGCLAGSLPHPTGLGSQSCLAQSLLHPSPPAGLCLPFWHDLLWDT